MLDSLQALSHLLHLGRPTALPVFARAIGLLPFRLHLALDSMLRLVLDLQLRLQQRSMLTVPYSN